MLTLYSMQDSGNCYKPRLLFAQLGIPFRIVDVDSLSGVTRKPEFLEKNPNGRVPLLEWEDGRRLAESNAMLLHFAEGSRFIPADPFDRAKLYEWLFFEQYTHEPAVAVLRAVTVYPQRRHQADAARRAKLTADSYHALGVMEERLAQADWIAGQKYSVADIALYAYTHYADQGGLDLAPFPGITAWLARVAAEAGHVPIDWRPEPA